MALLKLDKTHYAMLTLGAMLAVGAPAAYRAAVASAKADRAGLPMTLRWLDEGAGRPHRFALTATLYAGLVDGGSESAGEGKEAEIECDNDGSRPMVSNRVVAREDMLIGLCGEIAKFDRAAQQYLQPLAQPLRTDGFQLADMAQQPRDLEAAHD